MSEKTPTLQDVWRLLGAMNKRLERHDDRFDALERELMIFKADLRAGFGSLKASIEARDFRLDEHGRRLNELERTRE